VPDLFFFGTLCHAPLLGAVLGREPGGLDRVAACLHDYAVFDASDQPFALARPTQGGTADGVLVRGLDEGDLGRLEFYAGVFASVPRPVAVRPEGGEACQARMFVPRSDTWPVGTPWSTERWVAKWGAISTRAAGEVMAHFNRLAADEVARRLPGIRIRAAAWVAAQKRAPDPDHDLSRDVVVQAHYHPYSNFFATEEMDLQFRRYDGTLSPVLNRGAQMLGQACAVLPYDPERDAVLLVEQFRAPLFLGGDPAPWVWESVSGLIDPGETAEEAAMRETMEEAGLPLTTLERAAGLYSSTGSSSDFVHMFVGLGDFSTCRPSGGMTGEGEDIRTCITPFDLLMQGIDRGQYRDMPLVMLALWLARHRDRLREAA